MIWVWAVLFILTLVVEIVTIELVSVWFSVGSLVAFILALCKVGVTVQIIVFLAISIVLLASLRWVCVKFLKNSKEKTNLDSLVGKTFKLTKAIEEENLGEIKVNDVIWRVIEKNNELAELGHKVKIVEVQGNKFLVVKEKN